MFSRTTKLSSLIKLCNKTCGTTRFRIKNFHSNLHIDAEFSLRDIGCFDRKISRPVIQILAPSSIFQPKTNLSFSSSFFNDICCSKIPQVYVRYSFKPGYPRLPTFVLKCSLNSQDGNFKFVFRTKPLLL